MHDLVLVSLVGIIDPLRAEAVDAVRVAHTAGIDVRMITGDHTVTARAIADELGLGPGVITGTELSHLSDERGRSNSSRSCTSSAASPPRTRSASPG